MVLFNEEWKSRVNKSLSFTIPVMIGHCVTPFCRNLRPPRAPSDDIRKLQEWTPIIFHRVLWAANEPLTNERCRESIQVKGGRFFTEVFRGQDTLGGISCCWKKLKSQFFASPGIKPETSQQLCSNNSPQYWISGSEHGAEFVPLAGLWLLRARSEMTAPMSAPCSPALSYLWL